jgi:hypothetical protein
MLSLSDIKRGDLVKVSYCGESVTNRVKFVSVRRGVLILSSGPGQSEQRFEVDEIPMTIERV